MNQKKLVLAFLATAIIIGCLAIPVAATGTDNFVIMYVAGGDLEDKIGIPEGTDNVYNLIDNIDPAKTELLVFYGGARNLAGWGDGMAVADYACLKANKAENPKQLGQDANGNPTKNILGRIDTKMTTADGLKAAVEYANEYAKKKQISNLPRFIVLWDHGGGYVGFASDFTRYTGTVKDSDYNETIPVSGIRNALMASDKKFSIIIFDACLMSCIEVAYELKDAGDYLLASEELALGGLNYENVFGKIFASTSDPITIGKAIIKAYIRQTTLEKTTTLSLIDLSKINAISSALDTLGSVLAKALQDDETLNVLVKTYQDTHSFGVYGDNTYGTTADLSHFVSNIARYGRGEIKDAANAVGSAVGAAVIANEVQSRSPDSNGIAVAKFLRTDNEFSKYGNVISLSGGGWANYLSTIRNYIEYGSSAVPSAATAAAPQEATARGTSTTTPLVLENGTGMEVVMIDFLLNRGDGTEVILGQDLAEQEMIASDNPYWEYLPTDSYAADYEWNGAWFVLENKDTQSLITMKYNDEYTYNGIECVEFYVDGTMTRNGTTLDSSLGVTINADTGTVENVYVESIDSQKPMYVNEWGDGHIQEGDIFTPYIDIYNEATDTITTENGTPHIFSSNPESDFNVVQFDDDKIEWMYEIFTVFDENEKTFVDENGNTRESAKSPFPVMGILAGIGAAIFILTGLRK
ncbi:MAG TPA: clostripain-related cysteine peptidase [Methanocorpusculum sp.]|nr:clostripain-related cysteine peptidase [Methanocorpusculum sp.]